MYPDNMVEVHVRAYLYRWQAKDVREVQGLHYQVRRLPCWSFCCLLGTCALLGAEDKPCDPGLQLKTSWPTGPLSLQCWICVLHNAPCCMPITPSVPVTPSVHIKAAESCMLLGSSHTACCAGLAAGHGLPQRRIPPAVLCFRWSSRTQKRHYTA